MSLSPELHEALCYSDLRLDAYASGHLVPQDPADEPASGLLERIRNDGTHKV